MYSQKAIIIIIIIHYLLDLAFPKLRLSSQLLVSQNTFNDSSM